MNDCQAMASSDKRSSTSWIRVSRSHVAQISHSRTRRHPTEPQCSYDPVEGLTLAPDTDPVDKIRQLELQISESDMSVAC